MLQQLLWRVNLLARDHTGIVSVVLAVAALMLADGNRDVAHGLLVHSSAIQVAAAAHRTALP